MVIKQLHDLIETIPTKSLQKTVNVFLEENPGLSIGDIEEVFPENPLLKHKSRLVYNRISKKI